MRFPTSSPCWMALISMVALLCLTACGATTTSISSTSTPAATGSATSTPSTAGTTVTPTTALCNLMSLSQVGGVVGGSLATLTRGITMANGNTSVNCTYLPASGSGEHLVGQISYLFSSNGPASYAANQADDASRGETETNLSGLGNSAFWAVSAKNVGTLQLSVLKGNVLLVMTLLGTNPDGSTMLSGATALARLALPHI